MRRVNIKFTIIVVAIAVVALSTSSYVLAQTDSSQFSQVINAGTLATQIRSDSTTEVASPNVSMSAATFSFNCQSGGSASTGTFGTAGERIYVDNPDAADNGWTLNLAATSTDATWSASGLQKFDYNDSGGSGCTDSGVDTENLYGGQMTVNPSGASVTTDYSGSDTTGISYGGSTAYVEGTTDTINLVTAASSAADIWRGYFTGIAISQTIPAEQAADSYTIELTLTATAS